MSPEPRETKDIRSFKVRHLFSLSLHFIILLEKNIYEPLKWYAL